MLVAVQAFGQQGQRKGPPSAEERLERVTNMLESEMDLSTEKMAEVQAIYMKFFETMDKEREADRAAMREKRTGLVEDRNEELKDALSESEYDQLIALMEAHRKEMRNKRGKGPGGGQK